MQGDTRSLMMLRSSLLSTSWLQSAVGQCQLSHISAGEAGRTRKV